MQVENDDCLWHDLHAMEANVKSPKTLLKDRDCWPRIKDDYRLATKPVWPSVKVSLMKKLVVKWRKQEPEWIDGYFLKNGYDKKKDGRSDVPQGVLPCMASFISTVLLIDLMCYHNACMFRLLVHAYN